MSNADSMCNLRSNIIYSKPICFAPNDLPAHQKKTLEQNDNFGIARFFGTKINICIVIHGCLSKLDIFIDSEVHKWHWDAGVGEPHVDAKGFAFSDFQVSGDRHRGNIFKVLPTSIGCGHLIEYLGILSYPHILNSTFAFELRARS